MNVKRVPLKVWLVIAAMAVGAAVPSSRAFVLDALKAALTVDLEASGVGAADEPVVAPVAADGGS